MRNQLPLNMSVYVQAPMTDTFELFPMGLLSLGLYGDVVDACFREPELFTVGGTCLP